MTQVRRAATLPVAFFRRPTEVVAQDLLGMVVVSTAGDELTTARIVETEAYLGYDDPASHGYRHRRNARNQALFGPPGSWYVYLSYGMHWCANLVCQRTGLASAVLVRALEPLEGLPGARHHARPGWPADSRERSGGAPATVARGKYDCGDVEDRNNQGRGLAPQVCRCRITVAFPKNNGRRVTMTVRPCNTWLPALLQ